MEKLKKIFLLLILAACCLLTASSRPLFAQDEIVAIVNNEVITRKDLNDFTNFMRLQTGDKRLTESEALQHLIDDRLILSEAKKNQISVDEDRIKARIDSIKKEYRSDAQFQEDLQKQGMVQADLEARTREQMIMYNIIDLKVRSKIIINPAEVTDFYQKNAGEFRSPASWELDALVLEDWELAVKIWGRLRRGESMEDLAREYSLAINKTSMKRGEFKRQVEDIIIRLRPQGISKPVKIENRYYVFRLNKIISEHQQPLPQAQDSIYNFLYNKKMQEELARWLDELREQSYIKIVNE